MYALLHKYLNAYQTIDDDVFRQVVANFRHLDTKRNQLLLCPGEICRHYYFVNRGCLRLFAANDAGVETTRYFAFEGSFGTALPSFINRQPAFEFIQTIEASELLVIERSRFYHLVDTEPVFGKMYRHILEAAFITAQKRIYGFGGDTALQKLRWVMDYQPRLLNRVSNKMAASFLGITPSTLSRLKQKL